MYLWTVQLVIYFLFNSYNYSTANPTEGEYVPTFFGRIGNWFRNLKDRIVGFFSRFQLPAQEDKEISVNSNRSWDKGTDSNLLSSNDKSPEYDAEKNTFNVSTTSTESIINLSSEKSIEDNTEEKNINTSKNPQSAEVIEPHN